MSFDALDISASGLYAQRIKMDTVASNIANVNTTRNADGTPGAYRKKQVVFNAVYNNAVSNIDSGDFDKPFSASGNVTLKGNVSFDSPRISNGVQVAQITEDTETPLRREYNPSHPDADEEGYVSLPNVNMVSEMIDMISASRAYEANVTAIETTKSMMGAALRI